jgi:hypothetical protein
MKKSAYISIAIGISLLVGISVVLFVHGREPVSLTFLRYEPWPAAKLRLTNNSRKTITYVTGRADARVLYRLKTCTGWTNRSPTILNGTRIQTTYGVSGNIVSSTTNQYYFVGDLDRMTEHPLGTRFAIFLQTHTLHPGESAELYVNLEADDTPRRVGTVCLVPQGKLAQQFSRWNTRVKGWCRIKSKSTVPGQVSTPPGKVEVWCNEPLQISSKPTHGVKKKRYDL